MTHISDDLIETAVIEAQLEAGLSPAVMMARAPDDSAKISRLALTADTIRNQSAAVWTPEEEKFVDDNLGKLSLKDIGDHLGRSENAIKVRFTRLGLAAPSKRPGELAALQVGKMLGMCGKSVARLIDMGILPGRKLPSERGIRVVKQSDLLLWVVNPCNWIYFKYERVQDKKIKALLKRRRELWQDEWWSTGQVAKYHGVNHRLVNKCIHDGKLPAVRWANWHVLKSDAISIHFLIGKGNTSQCSWNPDGDAFIIVAHAIGCAIGFIGQLRNEDQDRTWYRLDYLRKKRLPKLIKAYDLAVEYDNNGRLWADWRQYCERFPGLVRAINRFLNGRPLSRLDLSCVRGVLRSWADWYAVDDKQRELAHRLKWSQAATVPKLWEAYAEILTWGIDPLGGNDG